MRALGTLKLGGGTGFLGVFLNELAWSQRLLPITPLCAPCWPRGKRLSSTMSFLAGNSETRGASQSETAEIKYPFPPLSWFSQVHISHSSAKLPPYVYIDYGFKHVGRIRLISQFHEN